MKSIKKVLVANRGEIAIRIFRTCYEMGIKTVAVFSDADKNALFVQKADEAICIGGTQASESYLLQDKIIAAAKQTGADAVHPGYGFLSENASFAKRCKDEGIIFIGPSAEVILKLGSKIAAKEIAKGAGVPTVPGYNGEDQSAGRLKYEAEEIGYPVLIKASAGGGGKGMRIVNTAAEIENAVESAKREAEKSFGDGSLLLEKYFPRAKHIEFQIFGDEHGNYFHLLERECSMQRRYQKVIEECPSPSLSEGMRSEMGEAAVAIARAVNYVNAGTVEFLFSPATADSEAAYYFLEVNTRLQVEHPVTESVTFTDLVQMQIMAAEGRVVEPRLTEEFSPMMHAIECRICAEDAANNFFPSTGQILFCNQPPLAGIRYDSGIESGSEVSVHYDSMIAKVISIGEDRTAAIQQMLYALDQYAVLGITTNTGFLKELLQHPQFIDGTFDTKLIERDFSLYKKETPDSVLREIAAAAFLYDWYERTRFESVPHSLNGWRNIFYQSQFHAVEFAGQTIKVEYRYLQNSKFQIAINGTGYTAELIGADMNSLIFQLNNHVQSFFIARKNGDVYVHHPAAGSFKLKEVPRFTEPGAALEKGGYIAPMPGEIVKVLVKAGDVVKSGKGLLVMSSMKMETTIEAHTDGEVEEVFVGEKNFVEAGTVLLKMKSE